MKNVHAVALGKRGGQVGGRSTSEAKVRTARANLAKARKIKLALLKKGA
jgi:hypothetical protein